LHDKNHDKAILKVVSQLLHDFHGLWYSSEELTDHLKVGRISHGIKQKTVSHALKGDKVVLMQNTYNNTIYFMLGNPRSQGWSPKQQKKGDAEEIGLMPHMPSSYFKNKPI
jgi:hypothetical protein